MQNDSFFTWRAWLKPLSFWGIFILALYLVMFCLMVIIRKQWIEKERLVYPLVQLPLEMVQDDERQPYIYARSHIEHPQGVNILGWFCRIGGIILMGIFMLMRYRFLWWPFHPLGFAIGGVYWIDRLWFSIFLVWLLKTLILKYGGIRLFRTLRPIFFGFVLGQYSAASLWFIIDLITGHTGNEVFWI